VCPGPILVFVVHELEQVLWNMHVARTDARALGNAWHEDRADDDVHVAAGSARIFSGGYLDRIFPCTPVMAEGMLFLIKSAGSLHCRTNQIAQVLRTSRSAKNSDRGQNGFAPPAEDARANHLLRLSQKPPNLDYSEYC